MKKTAEKILLIFGNTVTWSFTFICSFLTFAVIAVILYELIKGLGGQIFAGLVLAYGLYFAVKNANRAVRMGFVQFYSKISATPELDDPDFFEKQKEKSLRNERKI